MPKVVKNIEINGNKLKCVQCGREKYIKRDYYKSKDPRFGISQERCYWCKECLENKCFDANGIPNRDSFREILRDYLNLPFDQSLYEESLNKDKRLLGYYITQLNTRSRYKGKNLTWEDGQIEDKKDNKLTNNQNEEKIYSKNWSGYYTQIEIEYLDNYLEGLSKDFKIITTNHKDYAKKIAQASLAVNKAYQDMLNDVSGADKKYKDLQSTFDTLSKSAQFSENSRSANDVGITGIAQIVDKVESKQWIYDNENFKKDELDHILEQFENIKKSI